MPLLILKPCPEQAEQSTTCAVQGRVLGSAPRHGKPPATHHCAAGARPGGPKLPEGSVGAGL
jgi:hypothetical protein